MRLEIRRSQSTAFAVALLAVGAATALVALGFLGVAVLERNAGGLFGTLGVAVLAWTFLPGGIAAWRIARSRPAVVVTEEGVTIEDQGLFARPVHLSRTEVHSVYVRHFPGGTLPMSSRHCPDLSLLRPHESHNLLIVVASSMPLKDVVRRGLGAIDLILRGQPFKGPTRATVARGFFASVLDEDQARHAFASYPTAEAPDPELWDWLYAGTNRGFGWLGWRSRRAQQRT